MPSGHWHYLNVLAGEIEKGWPQESAPTLEKKADLSRPNSESVERIEGKNGGPCRGRTYGPLIKSQLLYQLS